jgi:hypothetical protein
VRNEMPLGEIVVSATGDTATPDAEIKGQLVSWANGSRGCWYAQGGRFTVDFVVGIHGNVFEAKVEGQDAPAADCAKNRLVGWRFPEAQASTHVTATIVARGTAVTWRPFDRAAAAAALGAIDVRACAGGPSGSGHVSVTFEGGGTVADATIDQPPFAGTPAGACVERVFRGVRVPAFDGPPVKVGKSFALP